MSATSSNSVYSDRSCPDDGRCSHDCGEGEGCWRVSFCAPLSGYGDDWTAEDKAANVNPPTRIESFIVTGGEDP